jgi:2-polyprenyl-6-methoxyphenol hydroxylase-like FAD-dependent oxidoreductase
MVTQDRTCALIIGGSLGGLFAATTLRAIGWDVQVFERSPNELYSRGGGVVLQPDVLAAFQYAGLRYTRPLGIPSEDRIFIDDQDKVAHRTYMPQTQTSWNMLYGVLKRGLPKDLVNSDERFVRFEQHENKVTAYFASGRVETGDLLIGADGVNSTVRSQLLPEITPRYAGYVAWRGLVPEKLLAKSAQDVLINTFAFQQESDHMLLEYMVPGQDESTAHGERRWNWVWYRKVKEGKELHALLTDRYGRRHEYSLPPGLVAHGNIDALNAEAKSVAAPIFQRLVEATEAPFIQAILDLEVPKMVFGRVILTGDAAFVPRPHTAGSTAKAAANARVLAELLNGEGHTIDAALSRWQLSQLNSGRSMVRWGISAGDRIMSIQSALNTAN